MKAYRCASFLGFLFVASSFVLGGCGVSDSAATNAVGTNSAGTGDNTGGTQDVAVDYFEVTVQDIPEVSFFVSIDGVRAKPCRYSSTDSATIWMQCIVDVDELDAFNNEWTFINTAPGDLCRYRGFTSYYYANAYMNTPPAYVSYEKNPNSGVVANVIYYFGAQPDPNNHNPGTNGTTRRAPPVSMPIISEADVKCPYDYSTRPRDGNGKNCCKGQYQAMVFNALDFAAPGNFLDAKDWGGNPKDCFHGPAMEDSLPKDQYGWPQYIITKVEGKGFKDSYVVASPNEKRNSQVYLSNYFTASKHTLGEPITTGGAYGGFPYYRYECLDQNHEIISRIDVMVREWNVKDQISVAGGAGNPDILGFEPSPFGNVCKNDFYDWDDMVPITSNGDTCHFMNSLNEASFMAGNFVIESW